MVFQELKKALKRAEHFSKDFQFNGPFSPIGREGLSIAIRNGLWFIDIVETPTCQEDFGAELLAFHFMARAINRWIDGHLVEGDEEAIAALAAFRSRMWWENSSALEGMVELEAQCQLQNQFSIK